MPTPTPPLHAPFAGAEPVLVNAAWSTDMHAPMLFPLVSPLSHLGVTPPLPPYLAMQTPVCTEK